MTPRDLATESELRRAMDAGFRKASERAQNSPEGMRQTARQLRQKELPATSVAIHAVFAGEGHAA